MRRILVVLSGLVLVGLIIHIGIGSTAIISPLRVIEELFRGPTGGRENDVVWQIRLPRALGCMLIGGILGTVGAAFQALFRNPLAEPYVMGVSSGAGVGGVAAILLGIGGIWSGAGLMGLAFAGGMAALALVMALSRRRGVIQVQTLLLAGVVTGSLLSAVLTVMLLAAGEDTNKLLRWLMGSTTPMFWGRVAGLGAALLIGFVVLQRNSRRLNAFSVGDETAQRLGVDVRKLRNTVLVTGTAMTSIAVGTAGIIGFVGLVAPHIARRMAGSDLRRSMAASALVGGLVLPIADLLSQRLLPTTEPVGAVTAIIGAPTLVYLLRRNG